MKKYWAISIPLILISLLIILFYIRAISQERPEDPSPEPECYFNKKTATLLGEVYKLSNPMTDPNRLAQFINRHWEYFNEDGLVIHAARTLGHWMLTQDVNSFDYQTLQQLHPKLEKCNLSTLYAYKILIEFKENNTSLEDLGRELIWLAEVLPPLASGNMYPYLTTGTEFRNYSQRIAPLVTDLNNSDPEIAELILHDRYCHYQEVADQVKLFALISQL